MTTLQRFDVGPRLSEMAVYNGVCYLAGQVAPDNSQDIAGQTRQVLAAIDALLARKQVIEALQGTRAEVVHLFNELATGVPEGVYLKSVRQSGARVLLSGYAQSSARVSDLMRNLEVSPLLERSALVEVKASSAEGRPVSEFTLAVELAHASEDRPPATGEGRRR